jgi:carbamate kinase
MGPKVEAALQFVRRCDKRAIICSIEEIEAAVAGKAGTQIGP